MNCESIVLIILSGSVRDKQVQGKWEGVYASVENLGIYPYSGVLPGGISLADRW